MQRSCYEDRVVDRWLPGAHAPQRDYRLILLQISAALRPASSVVAIRAGHVLVYPSDAHLRVASIPIFPPYAGNSAASSRSSTGPRVICTSRNGSIWVPTIHATSRRSCTSTSLSTT